MAERCLGFGIKQADLFWKYGGRPFEQHRQRQEQRVSTPVMEAEAAIEAPTTAADADIALPINGFWELSVNHGDILDWHHFAAFDGPSPREDEN